MKNHFHLSCDHIHWEGFFLIFFSNHWFNFILIKVSSAFSSKIIFSSKITLKLILSYLSICTGWILHLNFFNHPALTTTIPAQFVKKFGCKIQPVHIERHNKIHFKITFDEQIFIEENADETLISIKLNQWLEKKIRKNPSQWIWSHDRWK